MTSKTCWVVVQTVGFFGELAELPNPELRYNQRNYHDRILKEIRYFGSIRQKLAAPLSLAETETVNCLQEFSTRFLSLP